MLLQAKQQELQKPGDHLVYGWTLVEVTKVTKHENYPIICNSGQNSDWNLSSSSSKWN